jgi:hypothetical protein
LSVDESLLLRRAADDATSAATSKTQSEIIVRLSFFSSSWVKKLF